ncbi:MAG: hypothetical protein HPY85_17060 [Anaerolineae bacterium]|nr:hypothetical protein [Anaerolineae bacterium]
MTEPILGSNCHIILHHPAVNGGAGCGFLLQSESGGEPGAVAIQRERSSDGTLAVRVYFDVLLADALVTPAGGFAPWTRAESYAWLQGFLAQAAGITLTGGMGVLASLGALGHCATELHTPARSRISCQLSCAGPYYPPVDLAIYQGSVWDGALAWGEAVWR